MTTHRWILPTAALAALAALSSPAAARPHRRSYTSDKTLGLGIMVGSPTGLAGKYFLGGEHAMALQFGAGETYEGYHYDAMQVHLDVLWHPAVLAQTDAFVLPFYVGVGARLVDARDYYYRDRYYHDDDTFFGLRVPIGIAFDLTRAPLDIFAELVPVWDFGHDDDYDELGRRYDHDGLDLTGAVGLRYYF